jgi:uncharacterized GH25 family protein
MKMLFLVATTLLAHDTYLMPAKFAVKSGKPLVVAVHNGDSFPASEHATDPARLLTPLTDLYIAGRATHGIIYVAKPGSMSISAQTQPKLNVLPAGKFEAYLREEGLQHVVEARKQKGQSAMVAREVYTKYAKALIVSDAPDAGYATPSGLMIEIVPEADPFTLRTGSVLPAKVFFDGAPAPNLQVERACIVAGKGVRNVVGRTDRQGRIAIPIDCEGRWRLHAVHMRPSTKANADWESFWASLTFEVPPAR